MILDWIYSWFRIFFTSSSIKIRTESDELSPIVWLRRDENIWFPKFFTPIKDNHHFSDGLIVIPKLEFSIPYSLKNNNDLWQNFWQKLKRGPPNPKPRFWVYAQSITNHHEKTKKSEWVRCSNVCSTNVQKKSIFGYFLGYTAIYLLHIVVQYWAT